MSELPDGWTQSTLSQLCSRIVDGSHNPPNAVESGKPMLSARNIQRRAILFDDYRFISDEDFALEHRRTQIATNDILLTIVGTIGRVAVVPKGTPEFALQRSVAVLKPNLAVTPQYLGYVLESPRVQQHFLDTAKGTAQKGVYLKALGELALELAPLPEQTRITKQLDTLLARVQACNDRFDAIPALLKRFRQTVLDAATLGTLTESWRESNGGEYEWKEVQLRDIADVQGGVTKDSKKQSVLDEEVPYLRVANVQRGYIDLTVVKTIRVPSSKLEGLLLAEGDVLFNEGGDLDKLGRGWVWESQITRCTFQNHVFRARLFDKGNQPKFLSWWGNSRGLEYFLRSGKQTTNLASINKTMLAALPIRLPSAGEQAEIVRRVEALFALADRIEARCTAARAQAQRLTPLVLAKAFRGELVAQDPQDEPAGVLLQRIAAVQAAKAQTLRGRPRVKKNDPPPSPLVVQPNWAALLDGAWAAPADPDGHATVALLVAVLKAWGRPTPQMQARLAILLCQQPRLFTAVLPTDQALQWRRLVGTAAEPLPAQVASFQPATNNQWRRALAGMRARGDLVEAGSGPQATWTLGSGAVEIETAGWPDGRAGWVVAHLQSCGGEAILPVLEPAAREFVNVKAA